MICLHGAAWMVSGFSSCLYGGTWLWIRQTAQLHGGQHGPVPNLLILLVCGHTNVLQLAQLVHMAQR